MNKSPFDQLSRKMHALMEKMEKIKPFLKWRVFPCMWLCIGFSPIE